jgi:ADP-ribose pyrophosphatase YjhB (NUDIX family)
MSFEPEKFFVGIIDFFAILMPGAVLTYLFKDAAGPVILGAGYCGLKGTEGWAVFLFSSYLLGHFLFFIGSSLDDFVYDPLRKMTDEWQVRRILKAVKISPRILRWFVEHLFFKGNPDLAVNRVVAIKEQYLKRIGSGKSVNAFQWCKARLATEHRDALAAVNRFEADSKFFRSFVPVMLILLVTAVVGHKASGQVRSHEWLKASAALVAMVLAFVRYIDQRFKSTQQAYWQILTLEAGRELPLAIEQSAKKKVDPTHAGGVVFRRRGDWTEWLLVRAADDPNDWVLPKGHIESGERAEACAIREIKEETGVWASISSKLGMSKYRLGEEDVRVQFYLMERVGEGRQMDLMREHDWVSLEVARGFLGKHLESLKVLNAANESLPS